MKHLCAYCGKPVNPNGPACPCAPRVKSSQSSRNSAPDPEEDFAGFIEHSVKDVVAEMEANPEPEYWLAKSAARLLKMKRLNAPKSIIERCENTLRERIARFTGSETQHVGTVAHGPRREEILAAAQGDKVGQAIARSIELAQYIKKLAPNDPTGDEIAGAVHFIEVTLREWAKSAEVSSGFWSDRIRRDDALAAILQTVDPAFDGLLAVLQERIRAIPGCAPSHALRSEPNGSSLTPEQIEEARRALIAERPEAMPLRAATIHTLCDMAYRCANSATGDSKLADLLQEARGELRMVTATPKAMAALPLTGPAIEHLIVKIDAALRRTERTVKP